MADHPSSYWRPQREHMRLASPFDEAVDGHHGHWHPHHQYPRYHDEGGPSSHGGQRMSPMHSSFSLSRKPAGSQTPRSAAALPVPLAQIRASLSLSSPPPSRPSFSSYASRTVYDDDGQGRAYDYSYSSSYNYNRPPPRRVSPPPAAPSPPPLLSGAEDWQPLATPSARKRRFTSQDDYLKTYKDGESSSRSQSRSHSRSHSRSSSLAPLGLMSPRLPREPTPDLPPVSAAQLYCDCWEDDKCIHGLAPSLEERALGRMKRQTQEAVTYMQTRRTMDRQRGRREEYGGVGDGQAVQTWGSHIR